MSWHGTFEVESDDKLSSEKWSYWLRDDSTFELDYHGRFDRPTKRHKWIVREQWSRLGSQRDTFRRIERQEPSDFVKQQIRRIFNEQIKFI